MTDLISPTQLETQALELLEREWDELTVDEQIGKLNKLISPFFKTCE